MLWKRFSRMYISACGAVLLWNPKDKRHFQLCERKAERFTLFPDYSHIFGATLSSRMHMNETA